MFNHSTDRNARHCYGRGQLLDRHGAFHRPITSLLCPLGPARSSGRPRKARSLTNGKQMSAPTKSHLSRPPATRTDLLPELLAIGISLSIAGPALGQQALHVVPSSFVNNSSLSGTAAIANNDIWAVGVILGSKASDNTTLAEHFDGKSWSVIPTPSVQGGEFAAVNGVA